MSSAEPEQEHAGSGVGRRAYNKMPRLHNAKLNVELPIHRFGYPQQQTAALHTLKPDALRAKQECGFTGCVLLNGDLMGADDRPTERHDVDDGVAAAEEGAAQEPVPAPATAAATAVAVSGVRLVEYEDERQLDDIMSLVDRDLSEPYSIFTYRYFLHNWPGLCFVAKAGDQTVGSIVCKAERELEDDPYTGYIAMLAVDTAFRKHGIGTSLALKAIEAMRDLGCEEVVLETEVTNGGALNLYTKLGFSKNERLIKYYLNGVDAFRLKLWFR